MDEGIGGRDTQLITPWRRFCAETRKCGVGDKIWPWTVGVNFFKVHICFSTPPLALCGAGQGRAGKGRLFRVTPSSWLGLFCFAMGASYQLLQ